MQQNGIENQNVKLEKTDQLLLVVGEISFHWIRYRLKCSVTLSIYFLSLSLWTNFLQIRTELHNTETNLIIFSRSI